MTASSEVQWFIDAWSVMDGYAFASLRPPASLDAKVTFFLAPPYFEPEPVATLATALAATRGHFQEGFRDANGDVPFPSLAHVVETVRRAYRAGGLDIDGTPLPSAPEPRPEPAGGAIHPSELVDGSIRETWDLTRKALLDDNATDDHRWYLESVLSRLIAASLPALIPKCLGATVVEMLVNLARREEGRTMAAHHASAWINKARDVGVGIYLERNPTRVIAALLGTQSGFEWPLPEVDSRPELQDFFPLVVYAGAQRRVSDVAMPFAVPLPAVFQLERGRKPYPELPTLGHLLALATADRRYVSVVEQAHELVPTLVLALMQLPSAALPHPGLPRLAGSPEVRDLSERAARWLARTLPSGMLHNHPAEAAIHELTLRLLWRR